MSRKIERSVARRHYARFSKMWRDDLRLSKQYGKAGAPRKPTFAQWFAMHEGNIAMTKESSPRDYTEHISPGADPWAQVPQAVTRSDEMVGERGVATIEMVGKEDDE